MNSHQRALISKARAIRDGDGDGFIYDGTPRMRPYVPQFHTNRDKPGWKGKPVHPNPVGPDDLVQRTLAAAEAKRSIPKGEYPSIEAAFADLSRSWTPDRTKRSATRNGQTIRLVQRRGKLTWEDAA